MEMLQLGAYISSHMAKWKCLPVIFYDLIIATNQMHYSDT